MEEHKDIFLNLGNNTWESNLGDYYIDFSNSLKNYTHNVWGGGFDEDGIPFIAAESGIHYSPVNIAQFGLLLISKKELNIERLTLLCEKLVSLAHKNEVYAFYHHANSGHRYNLKEHFLSAMAQGEVASLFLRVYQLNKDERYLDFAKKCLEVLWLEVEKGGVLTKLEGKFIWLEEYPSKPASYVLNGFIYALYGLIDMFRVTGEQKYKDLIDECEKTLKHVINQFDAGYWSYYDLLNKELVRYYYHRNVHVLQLKSLAILFQDEKFSLLALKWEKQLNPINYTFVKFMYRILPRWRNKSLRVS